MIKIENFEVIGWEHAIRGMRNPMNSWKKSDSEFHEEATTSTMEDGKIKKMFVQYDALGIGPNDHELMMNLANGGPVHAKYRRMITVYVDITAPLYWWKEFDTYKVGTVANSCSTMHKIHEKEFTLEDFSHEYLMNFGGPSSIAYKFTDEDASYAYAHLFACIIDALNGARQRYLDEKSRGRTKLAKEIWYNMIQLLPSSYNQKRTVMLNYEVLVGIYKWRKEHKLDEWREFCKWIEQLPYSEIITGMDLTVLNKDFVIPKEENENE